MVATKSDNVISRPVAISFSPCQNASSRLTLVLCPAITIERLTTGELIDRLLVDPVPVEVLLGFFLPRRFELALRIRLTMRNAITRGANIIIASLSALSRGA